MIGVQNPWAEGLGFSFKKLDPRRHLRRGLKFAKATADPRRHLRLLERSIDPLTGLKIARRGLDPAGLLKHKRHGKHKGIEIALARLRARRNAQAGSRTPAVTMAVSSPEASAALGDLGFKLKIPHIGRKLRKKIVKYAAIGAAAYFTGGAALAALKAKPGLVGGLIKKVAGGVKTVAPLAKTVIKAQAVPIQPDSVTAAAGAAGIPTGGAPGSELAPYYGQVPGGAFQGSYQSPFSGGGGYTPLPTTYDAETGDVTTGISSTGAPVTEQAGLGGISPTMLLVGAGVAAFMLLGSKRR